MRRYLTLALALPLLAGCASTAFVNEGCVNEAIQDTGEWPTAVRTKHYNVEWPTWAGANAYNQCVAIWGWDDPRSPVGASAYVPAYVPVPIIVPVYTPTRPRPITVQPWGRGWIVNQ